MLKDRKKIFMIFRLLIYSIILLMLFEYYLRQKANISERLLVEELKNSLDTDLLPQVAINKRLNNLMYIDKNGCIRIIPNSLGTHISYDKGEDVIFYINSNGFRGPEPLKSPENRICFIGDSIVFDGGVPLKKSFVYMLENMLNNGRTERTYYKNEVLNLGTTNTGIDQYYLQTRYLATQFNPDYIFIGYYLNDAVNPQGHIGEETMDLIEKIFDNDLISGIRLLNPIKRLYRQIKYTSKKEYREIFRWAKRFAQRKWIDDKEDLIVLVKEANLDWGAGWVPETWGKIEHYLVKIKKVCEKEGIRLVVICFPATPQVYTAVEWPDNDYPQRRLKRLCEGLGIPFHDLLPSLRMHKDLSMFLDQCHLNSAGNRVVAQALYNFITDNPGVFGRMTRK